MDNNKKNKKKVSVKANTGINHKLILKKSFVIKKSDEILVLDKIYKKGNVQNINESQIKKIPSVKIVNSNIVNLDQKKS